jgi:hypothetical protein
MKLIFSESHSQGESNNIEFKRAQLHPGDLIGMNTSHGGVHRPLNPTLKAEYEVMGPSRTNGIHFVAVQSRPGITSSRNLSPHHPL